MRITNDDTGASIDEPLCGTGCGGFAASPNPLCAGSHGKETPTQVMARICAAVGHVAGSTLCLRCKATLVQQDAPECVTCGDTGVVPVLFEEPRQLFSDRACPACYGRSGQ